MINWTCTTIKSAKYSKICQDILYGKKEEMLQLTKTNDERTTRDLQTWFIGLINEGFSYTNLFEGVLQNSSYLNLTQRFRDPKL